MIKNISYAAKLYSQLATMNAAKEFNATLPISLKVLQNINPLKYLMRVGNATIEVKSKSTLEVGSNYWAFMGKSSVGSIIISNLQKQPKIFDLKNIPLKFDAKILQEFFIESKKPLESYKGFLLERLSVAQSREEFLFFSNILFSLEHNVLSFPMQYENRDSFLQLKQRKKKGKTQEDIIDFYAAFCNLGAVEGRLMLAQEEVLLEIKTPFSNTKALLEENIEFCGGVDEISVLLVKSVEPLYEFEEKLLDLKG